MPATLSSPTLKRTPLYDLHLRLGAKLVAFAGYQMPVQYSGIIKEHLHTRAAAGLFDVSHMGQMELRSRSNDLAATSRALETLVPGDISGLPAGRQRYTLFSNNAGGILDDFMVSNQGDHLVLVVNAARKSFDEAHLRSHLASDCIIESLSDRALVALQGPKAESALGALAPEVATMHFMEARTVELIGASCIVSRSGYTGEDGFEISVPERAAEALCMELLQNPDVAPVGLGARDSLRLEAGLCLYGSDLDEEITPVEAALDWTIPQVRRTDGARAGGFPGAATILGQLGSGANRLRVGLRPEGRAPVRGGTSLFSSPSDPSPVGIVTSGGFGVSLNAPVAMGYVPRGTSVGTRLYAEVRGKRHAVVVSNLPFVPQHYKRR